MRLFLVASLVVPLLLSMSKLTHAVEEPPHSIIIKDKKFELRKYEPTIVADVVVTGDMNAASNSGFKALANFIFGNNKPAEKIVMTAPVTRTENRIEQTPKSTKIAMTAPVSRIENDDKSWTITFVMPEKWSIDTLPKPNNDDVTIRQVPSELVATLRFAGRGGEATHRKKQEQLERWISDQGYKVVAPPRYAGYDAPWVPWPFRRNEVMIPVSKKQ